MFEQLYHSKFASELRANVRLQWMLLTVCAILLVSLSKTLFDVVIENEKEVSQKHLMVEKLIVAASKEIDIELLDEMEEKATLLLDSIPISASMNVAEAEVLKRGESTIAKNIVSSRVEMVGSEVVNIGGEEFWQVRIQVVGRLPQKSFIDFLSHFDGSQIFVRLNSLEYFPQSGDRVVAVVDYLYKKAA